MVQQTIGTPYEIETDGCIVLLEDLCARLRIPRTQLIAHADMAPTRKVDPNVTFPWQQLAQRGFGLWYSDTTAITVPDNFNHLQALRIIGYDVRDSAAAIGAFKRKYLQQESKQMSESDRKVLFALYQQYQ